MRVTHHLLKWMHPGPPYDVWEPACGTDTWVLASKQVRFATCKKCLGIDAQWRKAIRALESIERFSKRRGPELEDREPKMTAEERRNHHLNRRKK